MKINLKKASQNTEGKDKIKTIRKKMMDMGEARQRGDKCTTGKYQQRTQQQPNKNGNKDITVLVLWFSGKVLT
jgi:hypothetical protein